MKRKKILYGAGEDGCEALLQYGRKNVHCFVDRDPQRAGTLLQGVPIISVDEFCKIYRDYEVIISTGYVRSVYDDLWERGVDPTVFRLFFMERGNQWYDGNLYLKEWGIRRRSAANNQFLDGIIEKASHWDLLQSDRDFREYEDCCRELREKMPQRERYVWRQDSVSKESFYYGHLQTLLDYAGLSGESAIYLPHVEHGADLMGFYEPISTNSVVYSKSRKAYLQEKDPGRPVFTIGPLIRYAKSLYTDEQLKKYKESLGKTVLVFPVHTNECAIAGYSEKDYVDAVFERYKEDYKTIMVCIYYADLFDETCRLFRERGAKIVSCGFRFDPLFIRRLKSLLLLCDCMSTNYCTTGVGYSVYLQRPVDFFVPQEVEMDIGSARYDNQAIMRKVRQAKEVFCDRSADSVSKRDKFIEEIWGFSQVRTPEEIRAIVAVSKKLLRASLGMLSLYRRMAPWVLKALSLRRDRFGKLQYRILREALTTENGEDK